MFQALAETCNAMPGQAHEDEERIDADDFASYVKWLELLSWNVELAIIGLKIDHVVDEGENALKGYERILVKKGICKQADSLPKPDFNNREKVDRVVECFTKVSNSDPELNWPLIDEAYKKFRLNGYKTPPEYLPKSEI